MYLMPLNCTLKHGYNGKNTMSVFLGCFKYVSFFLIYSLIKISGKNSLQLQQKFIFFYVNLGHIFLFHYQDISLKTREIFTHLEPFSEVSGDGEKLVLNFEALKQRRFPPATENFLYHLAAAEQMLKI